MILVVKKNSMQEVHATIGTAARPTCSFISCTLVYVTANWHVRQHTLIMTNWRAFIFKVQFSYSKFSSVQFS